MAEKPCPRRSQESIHSPEVMTAGHTPAPFFVCTPSSFPQLSPSPHYSLRPKYQAHAQSGATPRRRIPKPKAPARGLASLRLACGSTAMLRKNQACEIQAAEVVEPSTAEKSWPCRKPYCANLIEQFAVNLPSPKRFCAAKDFEQRYIPFEINYLIQAKYHGRHRIGDLAERQTEAEGR